MSSTFPTTLDALSTTNTNTTSNKDTHPALHNDVDDAVNKLEAKVGINSSAVTTTHDYKLSGVAGSDKASSLAGTETFTNKTLTSPKVGTAICDTGGNEIIKTPATASAINEITITNAAAGNDVLIDATGGSTDIGIKIKPKGAGFIKLGTAELKFPNADGLANQVLTTNASAVLSWTTPTTAPAAVTIFPFPVCTFVPDATNDYRIANVKSSNTTMSVGLIKVPFQIIVNKISYQVTTKTTDGTYKIGLYSENGATKYIDVTTASITSTGVKTTTLGSPVTVPAGNYYIAIVSIGTASAEFFFWNCVDDLLFDGVAGEPIVEGTLAVTAGTLPATIDPTAITHTIFHTFYTRWDN